VAKTADVQHAIWSDPWFLPLPSDGKFIYLWGITNEHTNLAGLYVVAEETIRHETKLSARRLAKALEVVRPNMLYMPASGTVCIPSRPKHVRSKTEQIAKSIARAVAECVHPEIQAHYVDRYGGSAWLGPHLSDLALVVGNSEPHQGSTNLPEVPSLSHSQSQGHTKEKKPKIVPDSSELPANLDPRLAGAARRCLPILRRTAEARGAQPVTLLAVSRAIESFPHKDHAVVAGEVEHWVVHGNGAKRQAKDIVARFRNFLDGAPDQIRSSGSAGGWGGFIEEEPAA
jgi:hypothetical protein